MAAGEVEEVVVGEVETAAGFLLRNSWQMHWHALQCVFYIRRVDNRCFVVEDMGYGLVGGISYDIGPSHRCSFDYSDSDR